MKAAIVVANRNSQCALDICRELTDILRQKGYKPLLEENTAGKLGMPVYDADMHKAEFTIALGGDGTILRAVQVASPHDIPILGINMGNLGFLSATVPQQIDTAINRVLEGDYELDVRSMLYATVQNADMPGQIALNEIAITRGSNAGLTNLGLQVGNSAAGHYVGDGLMVATPTGSTAYSLSAGGPIVGPGVRCMIVTPICPHTLNSRPIVVSDEDEVTIQINSGFGDIILSADGQTHFSIQTPDRVKIQKAKQCAKFIRLDELDFYEQLRNKLSAWNRPGFAEKGELL